MPHTTLAMNWKEVLTLGRGRVPRECQSSDVPAELGGPSRLRKAPPRRAELALPFDSALRTLVNNIYTMSVSVWSKSKPVAHFVRAATRPHRTRMRTVRRRRRGGVHVRRGVRRLAYGLENATRTGSQPDPVVMKPGPGYDETSLIDARRRRRRTS